MTTTLDKVQTLSNCMLNKFGVRTPIKVGYYVTHRCNLECSYCYNRAQYAEDELSTDEAKRLIDQLVAMGSKNWKIGGGEPLIRKDLGEIIGYLKKKGMMVNVDTNGTMVVKGFDRIKDADTIYLSLDGREDTHDAVRGKGNFSLVMEAVEFLRGKGKPVLINSTLTDSNIDQVEYIIDVAESRGCFVHFQPVVDYHPEAKAKVPSRLISENVFDKIIKLKAEHPMISNSDESLLNSKRYYGGEQPKFLRSCMAGQIYCVVSPSGYISPCLKKMTKEFADPKYKGRYADAFREMKVEYNCDCTVSAYYEMSQLYSLNPSFLLKAIRNLGKGTYIYR